MAAEIPFVPLVIDNEAFQPSDAPIATHHSALKGGEPCARYVSATATSAKLAVDSSVKAFKSWSQTSHVFRRRILLSAASLFEDPANVSELVRLQVEETNCTEPWARLNVHGCANHIVEIAGRMTTALCGEASLQAMPGVTGLALKKPVGPVLSIPPWNAAVYLALKGIDTPLAVGCTVVLKASELCPRTHHFIASLFHKAGLPKGVLNVIQCRREDGAAVTEAAISHPGIRKVEFTGSEAVGRSIARVAGQHLKPLLLELGCKTPAIVLEDADLGLAAKALVESGFRHHGQVCFSTEKIIVRKEVAESFTAHAREVAAQWKPESAIGTAGPRRALELVRDAVAAGAELVHGEVKLLDEYTMAPVILTGVSPDMKLSQEEIFGPVVMIETAETDEDAVEAANASAFGLAAAVWSKDMNRALAVAKRVESGQTVINWPHGCAQNEITMGVGVCKSSGYGKQNAHFGLEEFLVINSVTFTDTAVHFKGLAAMQ